MSNIVVEEGEAAIVLNEDWIFKLHTPRKDIDKSVGAFNGHHILMMALFVRLQVDDCFNDELKQWFEENHEQVLNYLGITEVKLN